MALVQTWFGLGPSWVEGELRLGWVGLGLV